MRIIKVRPGDGAVLAKIAALDAEIFAANAWGPDSFSDSAGNVYDCLFAALEGERGLLGYGLLRCFDDAEIIRIAVDAEARRQGTGSAILDGMLQEARGRNVSSVFLEVRESNLPARSMYGRAGFAKAGLRKNYYSDPAENAVIMRYIC